MKSPIVKLYTLGFLKELTISSAILLPFYFSLSITEGQIFILLAIYQVSILFAEIPTGLIASRYGEKTSVIAGFLMSTIFFLCLPFATWFNFVTFLQIISAISVAFLSWSLSAFTNDLCKTIGKDFIEIRSKYKIITMTTWVLATILWWFLLYLGYTFVFWLQAVFLLLATIIISTIPINPEHKFTELKFFNILKRSYSVLKEREVLIPAIFIFSFLSVEAAVYTAFQSEYVIRLNWDPKYLGIFLSIFLLFSVGFTHFLAKKKWVLSPYFLILIGCLFILASGIHLVLWSIFSLLLLYFTQVIRPMDIPLENLIFKKINDNTGSTILSLMSFFERIMFLIITGVMNFFSLSAIQAIFGFSLFITVLYLFVFLTRQQTQFDK